MYRQALVLKEKVLGAEHLSTLNSKDDLTDDPALVLDKQSKYVEAEKMQQQVLQLYTKVLGAKQQSTLDSKQPCPSPPQPG